MEKCEVESPVAVWWRCSRSLSDSSSERFEASSMALSGSGSGSLARSLAMEASARGAERLRDERERVVQRRPGRIAGGLVGRDVIWAVGEGGTADASLWVHIQVFAEASD